MALTGLQSVYKTLFQWSKTSNAASGKENVLTYNWPVKFSSFISVIHMCINSAPKELAIESSLTTSTLRSWSADLPSGPAYYVHSIGI